MRRRGCGGVEGREVVMLKGREKEKERAVRSWERVGVVQWWWSKKLVVG